VRQRPSERGGPVSYRGRDDYDRDYDRDRPPYDDRYRDDRDDRGYTGRSTSYYDSRRAYEADYPDGDYDRAYPSGGYDHDRDYRRDDHGGYDDRDRDRDRYREDDQYYDDRDRRPTRGASYDDYDHDRADRGDGTRSPPRRAYSDEKGLKDDYKDDIRDYDNVRGDDNKDRGADKPNEAQQAGSSEGDKTVAETDAKPVADAKEDGKTGVGKADGSAASPSPPPTDAVAQAPLAAESVGAPAAASPESAKEAP